MSRSKSFLWGLNQQGLRPLSEEFGFPVSESVPVLGTEWSLKPSANAPFEKDNARISEMLERLRRLSHLPSTPGVKAAVVSTGALSLLDYVTKPTCEGLTKVRSAVRIALGMSSGSPEILLNVLVRGSLDPLVRWILTNLRLRHAYSRQGELDLLEAVARTKKGNRPATLLRELKKLNVELTPTQITCGGLLFYLRMEWSELRPRVLRALKVSAWTILAERRYNIG